MYNLNDVSSVSRDRVLDFLLLHMTSDTRRHLMATLPLDYAAIFPTCQPDTLAELVKSAVSRARDSS